MLLLEHDVTKKGQADKVISYLEFESDDSNEKKYKVEAICNNVVYVKKSKSSHLSGLDYLISWKSYLEEENIWVLVLAVQYLRTLLSNFYKKYSKKLTATLTPIDSVSPMAKPSVKLFFKLSIAKRRQN